MDNTKQTHKLNEVDKQNIIRDYTLSGNYVEVAKKYNICNNTVKEVILKSKEDNVYSMLINEQKKDIIANIWDIVTIISIEVLNRVNSAEKISRSALNQLVVCLGILTEKGLLLQGEATSIISNINKQNPAELNKAINDLLVKRNPEFKVEVVEGSDKHVKALQCPQDAQSTP